MRLKIIQTSDLHGCFFPYDFLRRQEATSSLCKISTYIKEQRGLYGDNLILLDSGDILQGQPTCYCSNYMQSSLPNLAASVFNDLGYDAITVGNHDIETGHEVYDKWRKELSCHVLGANIINKETGDPYFQPYSIIERQGIRIAVLGMVTQTIPYWLNEELWSGMTFIDIKECSRRWLDFIKEKEKPDIMVALLHTGWEGGISDVDNKENCTKEIANVMSGFDIILYGHDHCRHMETIVHAPKSKTLCMNPSSDAYYVSDIEINIEKKNGLVVKKEIKGRIIGMESFQSDKELEERYSRSIESTKNFLDTGIGYMAENMYTRDCFLGDAPLNDFIHRIQMEETGAQISLSAPLCYDECLLKGEIHISDLFRLYRYENKICALSLTGRELKGMLEMSYDQWINTMRSPHDHIFSIAETSCDGHSMWFFKSLAFNFDTAAGIRYSVDVREQFGNRVHIDCLTDGTPFSFDEYYTVAMHSYRANGGTEFLMKGAGISREELPKRVVFCSERGQRQYIMEMIEKMKVVKPMTFNNWSFVPREWTEPAVERDKRLLFGS